VHEQVRGRTTDATHRAELLLLTMNAVPGSELESQLRYAPALADTISPQLYGHVVDLVEQALLGEVKAAEFVHADHLDGIARFKLEMPDHTAHPLPAAWSHLPITQNEVDMAFSELLHRIEWDIMMAADPHTAEFFAKLLSERGNPI
jgi:hypothetical protein